MNCVLEELKAYLNERKLVTSYEMVATADEYVIIHKKERRGGDLMGQVGTKSGQNPHSKIRGDNRGIKGTQLSYNERTLMRKENRPMVCYSCGKQNMSQCQSGRGSGTNRIPMGKPQGVVTTDKIEGIYHLFVSRGFV